jgi:tetratricopeptide (TPR) repeat protein
MGTSCEHRMRCVSRSRALPLLLAAAAGWVFAPCWPGRVATAGAAEANAGGGEATATQPDVQGQEEALKACQADLAKAGLLERPAARAKELTLLVRLGEAYLAAGNTAKAKASYLTAAQQARRPASPRLRQIDQRLRVCQAMEAVEPKATELTSALQDNPNNAKARTELIELYLACYDDPTTADSLMTKATDRALRKRVTQAALSAGAADEEVCLDLADWFARLAAKAARAARPVGQARAAAWYEAYLDKHLTDDDDRTKALAELEKLYIELGGREARPAGVLDPPSLAPPLPGGTLELCTFVGHTKPIRDLAVCPDGCVVASCSDDGTIRLWDVATGKQAASVAWSKGGAAERLWFSPDGALLLAAGKDAGKQVWKILDLATCKFLDVPAAAVGAGSCQGFWPDGKSVIDGQTRRWNWRSGREVWTVPGRLVAISPSGARLITNTPDGLVLWNGATGKEVTKFGPGEAGAVFSPDGTRIGMTTPKGPVCYDGQTGKLAWKAEAGNLAAGEFSPDSQTFVCAGTLGRAEKQTILLYDARTGEKPKAIATDIAATTPNRHVGFAAGGKFVVIVAGHYAYWMQFYDVRTSAPMVGRLYKGEPYCNVDSLRVLVPSDKKRTPNVFSLFGLPKPPQPRVAGT